jgi:hypothetical protein
MFDRDAQMERESRRQEAIRKAIEEVDRIILDASDGTAETTDYLTGLVIVDLVGAIKDPKDTIVRSGRSYSYWQPGGHMLHTIADRIMEARPRVLLAVIDIVRSFPEDHPAVHRFILYEVARALLQRIGCQVTADLGRYEMDNPAKPQSQQPA